MNEIVDVVDYDSQSCACNVQATLATCLFWIQVYLGLVVFSIFTHR
jgi:hypothetical protein